MVNLSKGKLPAKRKYASYKTWALAQKKKAAKRKKPVIVRGHQRARIGFGPFDFVSVGLAAASGRLDIGAFGAYLAAMRPPEKKKKKR